MFGLRRHAAAEVPAAQMSELTDAQIFTSVHEKITELIGEAGTWTVSRRSSDDTDTIFHSVLAQSVSVTITAALVDARHRLVTHEPLTTTSTPPRLAPAPIRVSDATEPETPDEHTAFSWNPAPVTVWTDLRKPVTGTIPTIPMYAERPAA